jgi:4,5-dihydroxyphthalate decarboxylase
MSADRVPSIEIALDDHPHTLALKNGTLRSSRWTLSYSDLKPAGRFFRAMVRDQKFDVSELPIGAFLMAKAKGKPLVLLPATMLARFQHGALLCSAARPFGPSDLAGKTIGVRSYGQTTAIWVRGFLANDYGVDLRTIRWAVFEEGHVAGYDDPQSAMRVGPEKNMLEMLRSGEIDAAIYGQLPDDPAFQLVIRDADAAAQAWYAKHRIVPINHMVVTTETFVRSNPDAVREMFRLLVESKSAARLPAPDLLPFGLSACRPALTILIDYLVQQELIERHFEVDELFDSTTRVLGDFR